MSEQMILQSKDFSKNEIMKNKGNQVFVGCSKGYLYEYLTKEKKIGRDFGQIASGGVSSMATTFDNKHLFVCDYKSRCRELNIRTHKQLNNFGVENAFRCVVTYNNQFLITSSHARNSKLTKWSIPTKQQLHTWISNVCQDPKSQNCSYDNKYQFIGYDFGYLDIFDIQKDETIVSIKAFSGWIQDVAFTQDNQGAFISDYGGFVKMIKWKPNANTEKDFDFTEKSIDVGTRGIDKICLTRDDKNILAGSLNGVDVINIETRKVTKTFNMNSPVLGVKLIGDGTNALIGETNCNLTIINLETMEISSIHKKTANGKYLQKMALI